VGIIFKLDASPSSLFSFGFLLLASYSPVMFNFNQLYYQLSYCMPAQHPRWLGLSAKLIDGIRILMKMPSTTKTAYLSPQMRTSKHLSLRDVMTSKLQVTSDKRKLLKLSHGFLLEEINRLGKRLRSFLHRLSTSESSATCKIWVT